MGSKANRLNRALLSYGFRTLHKRVQVTLQEVGDDELDRHPLGPIGALRRSLLARRSVAVI